MTAEHGERLQKLLARAGLGSRRACEELVAQGRVQLNGHLAALGARADPEHDTIAVDGVAIDVRPDLVYLALHKPAGVVTTASDPEGRPTVLGLVPTQPRVFPVGRLDLDTAGLLLLTNDGSFANRIAHPRYEVPKTYLAELDGELGRRHVRALRSGIELDDGPARAEHVGVVGRRAGRTLVELTIREGRKRMIRRMFDTLGFRVRSLVRTAIGPLELGRLKEGTWRKLSGAEVLELLRAAETEQGGGGGRAAGGGGARRPAHGPRDTD